MKRLFAQPGAGATMNEAVVEASKAIGKRKPARAAIVVITSFGPEFSDRGFQFALDALADSGATLHVLELQDTRAASTSSDPGVRDRNVVIDRGTTETGGTRELLLANLSITDGPAEGRARRDHAVRGRLRPSRHAHSRPQGRGVLGATHRQGTGKHPAGEPDHTMTRAVIRQIA